MKRLELLVVQLEEAKRMVEVDRIAQLRLAYIVLDSAAEVILHRSTEGFLEHKKFLSDLLNQWKTYEAAGLSGEKFQSQIESLEKEVLSKNKVREIERNFDAKVSFMISQCALPGELAPVLKKLHQYRNEIYHRDELRLDLIRPATLIYFDIVCTLLDHYSQGGVSYGSNDDFGPELLSYIDSENPASFFRPDLHKTVAARMRDELGLGVDVVRQALTAYLVARLEDMMSDLTFIADNLAVPGLSADDALRLVQADLSSNPSLVDIRSQRFTYNPSDLHGWRERSMSLSSISDKVDMFTEYAAIEDDFEPLERLIKKAALEVDREVQLQLDIARGK
ncbi:hypothetical protein ACFV2N_14765 [Streptomyces sp. NPDC059680]|uniref:hypothetical protein n=1 Tax=Streptomyces sp. NPDC059680 TaxID=3346904 RepID=UPI00368E48DD